jgi:DNA-binding PucR family transcriptional regulator
MAATFVARELGPLAQQSRAAADLRQTLSAYLDTERSLIRAAERLHVARNTVAYRVRKAEDLLHRNLHDRTTELQCALRLAAMLPDTLLPSTAEDRRAPEQGQHRRPRQGHTAS